jgi:hypothetical protein
MLLMITTSKGQLIMITIIERPLTALQITDKGLQQINSLSPALKGRERQFLFLLLREDAISQKACTAMLPKVDVDSLVLRGLLISHAGQTQILSQDNTHAADSATSKLSLTVDNTKSVANISQCLESYTSVNHPKVLIIDDKTLDPILQLAAGMV